MNHIPPPPSEPDAVQPVELVRFYSVEEDMAPTDGTKDSRSLGGCYKFRRDAKAV